MPEAIELRVYRAGNPALKPGGVPCPALVYMPGLHGDWTLIGSFRRALQGRVCFVEMAYPRTTSWSLDDYAAGIEDALTSQGIGEGWILAESFGSQIAWALLKRNRFRPHGLILAGGFVRHPALPLVRLAATVAGGIPLRFITWVLFGYAKVARLRFRNAPEVGRDISEFIARRTEEDRKAAQHRLRLIVQNDSCALAQATAVPVFAMTGLWDPVVPWWPVKRWLRKNCVALREHRVVRGADHNVLGTAPEAAAEQVLKWVQTSA